MKTTAKVCETLSIDEPLIERSCAPSPNQLAYTPKEFAAFFNRSATWGYRQLYAGKIRRLSGSDSILIPRSELERFLSNTVRHGDD